jgi:hypothetical protein
MSCEASFEPDSPGSNSLHLLSVTPQARNTIALLKLELHSDEIMTHAVVTQLDFDNPEERGIVFFCYNPKQPNEHYFVLLDEQCNILLAAPVKAFKVLGNNLDLFTTDNYTFYRLAHTKLHGCSDLVHETRRKRFDLMVKHHLDSSMAPQVGKHEHIAGLDITLKRETSTTGSVSSLATAKFSSSKMPML